MARERSVHLDRLKEALEAIDTPAWCEGVASAKHVVLDAPDGGKCSAADPRAFVDWLVEHSEPAPFGHQNQTRLDTKVRATLRLRSRGRTKVDGIELDRIVERIEEAFATPERLKATLLDVLTYPVGGKFLRHKDTPRSARQLGTLIIGLPVPHQGGALRLEDGEEAKTIDWSGPVEDETKLHWVALFGDVDHTIASVASGARVTLVYTLELSGTPRNDAGFAAKLDAVADAVITLASEADHLPADRTIYIPCERLVVRDTSTAQLALDSLRGNDLAVAEVMQRCGARVDVWQLLIPTEDKARGFPSGFWGAAKVVKSIPQELFSGGALSFTDDAGGEYVDEGEVEIAILAPYIDNAWIVEEDAWVVRAHAHAKLVFEGLMSSTGYFGNECNDGFVYQCAALEVLLLLFDKVPAEAKPAPVKAKAKPKARPKANAKAKAKVRAKKPAKRR